MERNERSGETSRFLEDEPCHGPSDFQIHERIAQAIAYEIKTGESGNIALVGNWGSGKSTIVDRVGGLIQLENETFIENGEESAPVGDGFIYFKFDAWAHSGDSLRRNFLASLADALKSHEVLSEKEKKKNRRSDTWANELEHYKRRHIFRSAGGSFDHCGCGVRSYGCNIRQRKAIRPISFHGGSIAGHRPSV